MTCAKPSGKADSARLLLYCMCSSVAFSYACPAFAQTTEGMAGAPSAASGQTPSINTGPDIVVTAQKRSERLSDVPMSISAVSGGDLVERGIADVDDLAKIVPGFQVAETFYGAPVYTLRGMGFYDNSLGARPAVTVYLDEVGLPFSVMAKGATLDLERVEVLKGPQGTLFGQNSTGGAINYIAAKPTPYLSYGVDASFGRFRQGDIGGFISGPLGPNLSARLAVKQVFGDDWQKSYTRDDSIGQRNTLIGRLILDWKPGDGIRFSLNINGWRDKSDLLAPQFIDVLEQPGRVTPDYILDYPTAPDDSERADWTPGQNDSRNDKFYQLSLRTEIDLSDSVTLTSLTAYSHFDAYRDADIDGISYRDYDNLLDGELKSFSQELRLSGEADSGINWIIGANYQKDQARQLVMANISEGYAANNFIPFGLGRFERYDFQSSTKYTTHAIFGNVALPVVDSLTFRAGARYSDTQGSNRFCAKDPGDGEVFSPAFTILTNIFRGAAGLDPITIAPGGCVTLDENLNPGLQTVHLDEDNLSWRLGLDWKPTPDLLIYANVSKGYKGGSFPFLGATQALQAGAARQESVQAYEIGFKASLAQRLVQISGATFYYNYRDKQFAGRIILSPNLFGPQETLVNVPKSRVFGGEIQIDATPVEGLRMGIGATYLDTKIQGTFVNFDALGQVREFAGEDFPFSPRFQVIGDVEYKHPLAGGSSVFVGASGRYQSSTKSGFGDLDFLKIDDYGIFDMRAGVEGPDGSWRVSAFVRNLTDKFYTTSAFGASGTIVRTAGEPRTFGITLSLRSR